MDKGFNNRFILLVFLILSINAINANQSFDRVHLLPTVKTESIDIEIVFIGYDQEYTNEEVLEEKLPQVVNPFIFLNDTIPHSEYNINYSISSFSAIEKNNFEDYIDSIKVVGNSVENRVNITAVDEYILNGTYEDVEGFFIPTDGYEISAELVKDYLETDFLANNRDELGYTLYLLNLSHIDNADHSTKHTFSYNLGDADASQIIPDHPTESISRKTMGWGGDQRFCFVDLSAITADMLYYTLMFEVNLSTVPLYTFFDLDSYTQTLNLSSIEGQEDLTTYISQWIHTYVNNVFLSQAVYNPPVNEIIELPIIVFSNISEIGYSVEDYSWAISSERVNSYLESAFPWIIRKIELEFLDLADYPEILMPLNYNIEQDESGNFIDVEHVISLLDGRKTDFYEENDDIIQLPSFIFLTDYVRFKYENINLGGIAVGDYQILVRNPSQFFVNGDKEQPRTGLTHTIVHEIGHNLGLDHPHNFEYGYGGLFVEDVMSYKYSAHSFSVFSTDTVARFYYDYYMWYAQFNLGFITNTNIIGWEKATNLVEESYEDYKMMDYITAVEKIIEAWKISTKLEKPIRQPITLSTVVIISSLSVVTISIIIPKYDLISKLMKFLTKK